MLSARTSPRAEMGRDDSKDLSQSLCSERRQSLSSRSHSCWELPDNLRPASDESSQQGASRAGSWPTGSSRAQPSPPTPPLPSLLFPPLSLNSASASDAGLWQADSGLKEQLRGLKDSGQRSLGSHRGPGPSPQPLSLKVMAKRQPRSCRPGCSASATRTQAPQPRERPFRFRLLPARQPLPVLSPHVQSPWITCYLNEPLPRFPWLLTFLNDES